MILPRRVNSKMNGTLSPTMTCWPLVALPSKTKAIEKGKKAFFSTTKTLIFKMIVEFLELSSECKKWTKAKENLLKIKLDYSVIFHGMFARHFGGSGNKARTGALFAVNRCQPFLYICWRMESFFRRDFGGWKRPWRLSKAQETA